MNSSSDNQWTALPPSIALKSLLIAMGAGLLCVLIYAIQALPKDYFAVAFAGILLSGASALLGAGLGFLFGIPRTLQPDEASTESPSGGDDGQNQNTTYRANTNLEQISDWLTKIIVGVGLTQLLTIDDKLRALGKSIAPALGGHASSAVAAVSIILFFSIAGFFFGFLWTRLYLAKAFRQADAEDLKKRIDNAALQIELNTRAVNMVTEQLDSPDSQVTEKALNEAVEKASRETRIQIAHLARTARKRAYEISMQPDNDNDTTIHAKSAIARTASVFRALIKADKNNRYHQNHAELAFALKDQLEPEFAEAEKELTKAINIRKRNPANRPYHVYEFVRALCRIELFDQTDTPKQERIEAILKDLRYAAKYEKWAEALENAPQIREWLQANEISEDDLHSQPRH